MAIGLWSSTAIAFAFSPAE